MTNVSPVEIAFSDKLASHSPSTITRNPPDRHPLTNGHVVSMSGQLAQNDLAPALTNGVQHSSAGDAFRVGQRSSSDAGKTNNSTSLTNSRSTLLVNNEEKGISDARRIRSQALFVRLDAYDEKLYRAYFRRQRVGVLPALVALATSNAVVQVTLDLVASNTESRLDRLIVLPTSAVLVWVCFFIALTSWRESVVVFLEVASWMTLTFQILYDVGTNEPGHVPSERLGLALCLVYLSQMALPFSAWSCVPLVTLLVLLHCLVTGLTWAREDSNITRLAPQMLGNSLLCLACIAIGVSRCVFLDMLNRRSLLETKSALEAKGKIELAYKNKERLLLSVLPKHVADEMLKDVGSLAPDGQFRKIYMSRYENVSILFADIVGFTAISSSVTAAALVSILNELFASFDVLAEKFHQTRIKILGDCYYCICGALEPRADHAVLTIHMGLSMVDAISSVRQKTGKEVNMRVGVHTGACLGGVLGQRQWQFDVLGKEVTLANKMESGGLPARVHISEMTHKFLDGEFELEDGHGADREDELKLRNITTYLVKGVLKPYPQGTLDMKISPDPRQTANKRHSGDKKSRSSLQASDTSEIKSKTEAAAEGEQKALEEETRPDAMSYIDRVYNEYNGENSGQITALGDNRKITAPGDNRQIIAPGNNGQITAQGAADFTASLTRELAEMHDIRAVSKLMTPGLWRFREDNFEKKYSRRQENYSGLPLFGTSFALLMLFLTKMCVFPLSITSIALYLIGVCLLIVMGFVVLAETLPNVSSLLPDNFE
ncbi:adenylate cyclase type 3-like [Elysia marginata]|uniref:adenylate cyclase n=1 Tax=Elysia marginata TaxID=1093978 RepID=A0AAV4IVV3_9GAST|nr:adenylate cyclase type 3-like [Elysia marginata]